MNQDNTFLRETFLIEELEKLCNNQPLQKNAGLYETLGLPSVAESIKSFARDYFKDSSEVPGGYFTSLLNLLTPGVLFRINPFLGGLYTLFSMFGFSLSDMVIKVANYLKPKLEQGEPVTPQEVQNAAASIVGAVGDIGDTKDHLIISAYDQSISEYTFEYFIKEASLIKQADEYQMQRTAGYWDDYYDYGAKSKAEKLYKNKDKLKIPFLSGGGKEISVLQRIFGNLLSGGPEGKSKIRWFGIGFVVWILKTALAGAGLLAIGGLAAKMLGIHKKPLEKLHSSTTQDEEPKTSLPEYGFKPEETTQEKITPKEEKRSTTPSSGKIWLIPLVGDGSVKDTIRIWALDLYPELEQYPNINNVILGSAEFKSLIEELTSDYSRIGEKFLQMPSRYSSRKQVVDQFIDDVQRKINVP